MLDKLRSSASTWVMRVLLLVLAASFAVWGIGDIFRGRSSNTVASVGDASITPAELDEQFRREIQLVERRLQQPIDSEQARAFGLLDRALNVLVGRALMNQEISSLGITVDDTLVAKQLYKTPAFQNSAGKFDPDTYKSVLAANGYTTVRYENEVRREIAQQQLLGSIGADLHAPAVLVDALHRYRGETRRVWMATIPVMPEAVADPDEATVKAYYDEHQDRFTAPEYRKVTYIELSPQTLAGEVKVTEDDLKAEYESRINEFSTPEKRTVEQISFPDEESAEEALKRIRAGEDFLAVAKDAAGQDADAVKLGTVTKDELLGSLADAAFALNKGEVSDPVKTPLGWHLVRVTDITEGHRKPLEEVRDEVERSFRERHAFDLLYPRANEIEDELAAGSSLDEIARVMNLTPKTVPALDSDGRDTDGKVVDGVAASTKFIDTAFATDAGQISDLVETDSGSYFLLRVDEVTPEALKPLDTVRDEVVAAYKHDQAVKIAEERAKAVKAAVEGGSTLPDAIKSVGAEGAELARIGPINRQGEAGGAMLMPAMVFNIFSADKGGVAEGVRPDGARLLAVVTDIEEPEPLDDAARKQFAETISRSLGTDLLIQYQEALREAYPTRVNSQVIQNMY